MIDYYELLQISPKADGETIHRVYRYLAARLHPDNGKTGDAAKFRLVKAAYDTLSHPLRRTEYDAKRSNLPNSAPPPLSTTIDFMDQLDGENNRRMAVLAVLYYRRRMSPNHPEVSLGELEERMGFPRDYLDFTLWYLAKKRLVDRTDNITFSLTADGVDFVEKERASVPVLNGLLTANASSEIVEEVPAYGPAPQDIARKTVSAEQSNGTRRIVLPSSMTTALEDDRRTGRKDRRVGNPDLRIIKVERRKGTRDRRSGANGKAALN